MLLNSKVNVSFWDKAVKTIVYLLNRSPTKANGSLTPEELFTGQILDLSHLRVFGCLSFVHIPSNNQDKLNKRANEGLMMGYDNSTKGYKVFITSQNTVV